MNRCSICSRVVPLFCPKCVQSVTVPKEAQLTKLEHEIQIQNDEIRTFISTHMKEQKTNLIQNQRLFRSQKHKAKLKQQIKYRKSQINARKEALQLGQHIVQKREEIIEELTKRQKQMELTQEGIKSIIQTLTKESQAIRIQNKTHVQSKCKDIQYAYFDQGDAKLVQSLIQIKDSDQIVLNQAYNHYDLLQAINCEKIKLKQEKNSFLTFNQVRVLQRNIGMVACVLRVFGLWVPHQIHKQNSTYLIRNSELISGPYSKIYGIHKLKIDQQYLQYFQADLQHLSKVLNSQQRPFICPSRHFLKRISDEGNRTGLRFNKGSWKSCLDCLKAQNIQFFVEPESKRHLGSYLPPLSALNSGSSQNEEEQQYQLLVEGAFIQKQQ